MAKTTGLLKSVGRELDTMEGKLKLFEFEYTTTHSKETPSDIHTTLAEFNKLAEREVQYMAAPARAHRYGESNKAGKFLAQILKAESCHHPPIAAVQTPNGNMVNSKQKINDMFAAFYKSLYSNQDTKTREEITEYLHTFDLPTLTPETRMLLDTPISLEERTKEIKTLTPGRAPRSDGLGAKIYTEFHDMLAPDLLSLGRGNGTGHTAGHYARSSNTGPPLTPGCTIMGM